MIRNSVFILFLSVFAALPIVTTGQEKSERYQKLKSVNTDADDLLKEAEALKEHNASEALDKVEEALGISLAQRDVLNESKSYIMLGEINMKIGEWKLALDNFTNAYEKLKDNYRKTPQFKEALRGLAITNVNLKNYQPALQFYEALLSTRLNATERVQTDIGISDVYYHMGNYDEALKIIAHYNSPKSAVTANTEGIVKNQQAKIYARMNEAVKARDALISSQNTLRSAPSTAAPQKLDEDLKEAKEEVAGVLHDQKRYDDEIALRNQSIEYNLESNNLPEVTKDKVGLSKALAAKGETSEAIRELEEAALMADTINNPKDQAKAFLALADIYEKNGRSNQALSAYKRYSSAVRKTEEQSEAKLTEKAELIKKQRDIEELRKDVAIGQREETIAMATVFRQQLIIYGLIALLLVIGITSYFIYRNAKASKIANQLLALKSLRSQMNPHFIFNALNSVNQFIAQNDERTANKFLTEFSRLMRLVMENSQEDFIPLHKEKEIISLYLKLEHYRFRDKFDYEINIDDNINADVMEIPPMLLQPYIENAVWHGLRYKETKGHLSLNMRKNSHGIEVEIADDGIGRKRSAALKTENQKKQISTGLSNIEQRLKIINKVYKANYRVAIEDLNEPGGTGTRVVIHVPEHKQNGNHESSNY
jgi:tetratricopeptide (TPR) repeat protein